MAQRHAHSQPIETYGLAPLNRNIWPTANQYKHMAEPHAHSQPIETYGLAPHNRNIWPHNSRATAAPSRLADSFVCAGDSLLITTHRALLTISFLQVEANCPADLSLASTYLGIFVKEFRIIEHFLEKLLICANPESNKQLQTYRQADR